MRRLAAGILAGFSALLAYTIFVAHRSHEGLVERNYYESAVSEFSGREEEERAGFRVTVPETYRAGRNRFEAVLEAGGGPLRDARVTLAAMRPSGTGDDRSFALREESPGVYSAEIHLPGTGQWMLALSVDGGRIHARRRWTVVALPEGPPSPGGTLRAPAGNQEVILSVSPWPPPAMHEVSFGVELPGYPGGAPPHVDLSMPGMEMGRNRVPISRGADGIYRGTGVFVRCASGSREWEAAVTVPDRGKAVFRIELAD